VSIYPDDIIRLSIAYSNNRPTLVLANGTGNLLLGSIPALKNQSQTRSDSYQLEPTLLTCHCRYPPNIGRVSSSDVWPARTLSPRLSSRLEYPILKILSPDTPKRFGVFSYKIRDYRTDTPQFRIFKTIPNVETESWQCQIWFAPSVGLQFQGPAFL
jgi:hypothetical protein